MILASGNVRCLLAFDSANTADSKLLNRFALLSTSVLPGSPFHCAIHTPGSSSIIQRSISLPLPPVGLVEGGFEPLLCLPDHRCIVAVVTRAIVRRVE